MAEHPYHPKRGQPGLRRRVPPALLRKPPVLRTGPGTWVARLLLAGALITTLLVLAGASAAYGAYAQLANSLQGRLDTLQKHQGFQTSRIYDRHGTLLYEFFDAGKRTRVPLTQISPLLINATISIEDKTFFKNSGVDYEGIMKAAYRAVNAGAAQGGASTITQQLIKQAVLTEAEKAPENLYKRKMTEIILAQELSQRYTKDDILELYLNEIYYGNLAYGIEAASNVYFNKHANQLTLAEASLLAGLPQLPTVYDPINYLEGSRLAGVQLGANWLAPDYLFPNGTSPPKKRQAAVLTQMVDEGYVSEAQARAAAAEDLRFSSQIAPINAPHFVFYVRKLLEESDEYGPQFTNQGLSIYTTLDLDMQRMVQQKAAERIRDLQERNIHNAAVVVMQPNTGQILSMVGSIDYNASLATTTPGEQGNVLDGQVNVTTRDRQPGSALKPFTYLSAMQQGMTPASILWDVPTEFPPFGPKAYKPLNYNGRWNGPVRIRTALANSLNMPAVKALKFAGIQNTLDLLHRAGITGLQNPPGYYGLALTLGGGEVTPLDLTTAYNTLASAGTHYEPMAILKIIDSRGNVREFQPRPTPNALDPDHVAIVTNMMSDDQARAPIWGLNSKLKLSRPAAVKTGTSNDWRDAWTVGFTPYVTVGVWSGNNNNEPTAKVESLTGGGVIWHNVMEALFATPKFEQVLAEPYGGTLPREFQLPPTLVRKSICQIPGPFNRYAQELFAPAMVDPKARTDAEGAPKGLQDGCDAYRELTVAKLGDQPVAAEGENGDQPQFNALNYCKPVDGVIIPPDMLTTIQVWNVPPDDPDEKVEYRWQGGSAASAAQIPDCTESIILAVAPPGSVRMPDLRRFGENQAKERLAELGITNVYVDYQTRERIPELFDSYAPYAVVSTLPEPGAWVPPDTTVVLGVRAPDEAPPPATEPTAEPTAEPPPGPPPDGGSTPIPPPIEIPTPAVP
ncbi:MAG: transglycosylase domain-containing protein [Kouleothrix sp.]|jgi:peptidoglycan glycosyltransferase|nr:transglycosylase domain-containing protein [Kouleothrix sp.]